MRAFPAASSPEPGLAPALAVPALAVPAPADLASAVQAPGVPAPAVRTLAVPAPAIPGPGVPVLAGPGRAGWAVRRRRAARITGSVRNAAPVISAVASSTVFSHDGSPAAAAGAAVRSGRG